MLLRSSPAAAGWAAHNPARDSSSAWRASSAAARGHTPAAASGRSTRRRAAASSSSAVTACHPGSCLRAPARHGPAGPGHRRERHVSPCSAPDSCRRTRAPTHSAGAAPHRPKTRHRPAPRRAGVRRAPASSNTASISAWPRPSRSCRRQIAAVNAASTAVRHSPGTTRAATSCGTERSAASAPTSASACVTGSRHGRTSTTEPGRETPQGSRRELAEAIRQLRPGCRG